MRGGASYLYSTSEVGEGVVGARSETNVAADTTLTAQQPQRQQQQTKKLQSQKQQQHQQPQQPQQQRQKKFEAEKKLSQSVSNHRAGPAAAGNGQKSTKQPKEPLKYKNIVFRSPEDAAAGYKIPLFDDMQGRHATSSKEELCKNLKENVRKALMSRQWDKLLSIVTTARLNEIELDHKEYMAGLEACDKVADARDVEAYSIYAILKKDPAVPQEVFATMLRVCRKRLDAPMALSVMGDYDSMGFPVTYNMMCDLLTCLVCSKEPDIHDVVQVYDLFSSCCKEQNWKISEYLYHDVIRCFIRGPHNNKVFGIMRDMLESNTLPSPELATTLLKTSLFHGDAQALLILATWYSSTTNANLEHGVLTRLLQIAASSGEGRLAQMGMQLLAKTGHKARPADYACWIRACINGQDVVGGLEALMEANEQGFDLLERIDDDWTGGEELLELMAADLSRSVRRLDDVYFALVDLVRGNYSVPRIAVHAVIMAAGRMGQIDRSFATFQEAQNLFNLDPDVQTYNALLWACSNYRGASIHTLLTVFQEMDAKGIKPNGESFSILLQTMSDCGDFNGFDDIFSLIKNEGVVIKDRALRCLIVALAKAGDWKNVDMVCGELGEIPRFLGNRLVRIKAAHEKKALRGDNPAPMQTDSIEV